MARANPSQNGHAPLPPPHSAEAEMAVLGSALMSTTAALYVAENLKPEQFYFQTNRRIAAVMREMVLAGTPVDPLTLQLALTAKGWLESVGGLDYLAKLTDSVPTAVHHVEYAQPVRENASRRALIKAAEEITAAAHDQEQELPDLLALSEEKILQVSEQRPRTPAEPITDWLVEARTKYHPSQGRYEGLRTGFPTFDRLTGGILPTDLIVGGSRFSQGKSIFGMIAMSVNVSWLGKTPVLVYSHEMDKEPLQHRYLANISGLSSRTIRNRSFTDWEWEQYEAALTEWSHLQIYIHAIKDYRTALELVSHARREKRDHPEIGLVIIDHLNEFELPGRKPDHLEIGDIVTTFKDRICREMGTPTLLLAQINRQSQSVLRKGERRPEAEHLKGSGKIEEKSDHIFLLHRQSYYERNEGEYEPDTGMTELRMAKSRNGQTGQFKLWHSLSCCQYREESEVHTEAPDERIGRDGY